MVAEDSSLFTTLDVILDTQHNEGPNQLFTALPLPVAALLLDLFVFPEV